MGNGFLGEHVGKGSHDGLRTWLPSSTLITTEAGVRQEETEGNPRGSFPHLGTGCPPVQVQLPWVDCSHVQNICQLSVSKSPVLNSMMQMSILT